MAYVESEIISYVEIAPYLGPESPATHHTAVIDGTNPNAPMFIRADTLFGNDDRTHIGIDELDKQTDALMKQVASQYDIPLDHQRAGIIYITENGFTQIEDDGYLFIPHDFTIYRAGIALEYGAVVVQSG